MDQFFKKKHPPLKIFIILFSLNVISLLLNLLSAWGIILPFIFVLYMGLNIGIVMYHSLEGRFYYMGLLNPVAILELPAAWLSITMAVQFSMIQFFHVTYLPVVEFSHYLKYFLFTVVPLLFIAGILETILIVVAVKKSNHKEN